MKKIILFTFALIAITGFSQNNSLSNKTILENSTNLLQNENSTIPKYIEFGAGFAPSLNEVTSFLNHFSKNNFTLVETDRSEDQIGFTHIKFQQVINNIPLELNFVAVHIKNGVIKAISGNLESNIPSTNTAVLTEKNVLNSTLNIINANEYKWERPEEEAYIKEFENNQEASFYPKGELVYFGLKSKLRLVYKFNVYAHEPVSRADYYMDAVTGKLLFKNDIIKHANAIGSASTGYSGTRVITTDSTSTTNYRLRETGRGLGIETYDCNTGTSYGAAVDFTDSDNNWTSTANDDQYALDAHWGAEMTYDYFWNVHARNSINGSGFKLVSYVHYDNNYVNAFWDGSRMTYGDGNGTSTSPLTTMAVAGHEITHGLTSNTANLVYSYESGALNESFSDIFGVCIDFWSRPTDANWLMGDEIYTSAGSYFRSMSNPNAKNDPDTYGGTHYYTGTADNGGVHTNSGVQNFWFYLLVNGGTGTNDNMDAYSVAPLGFDTASRIAFRNLTVYLSRNSQHSDARFYAIKSATDLYGACSPAVIATTNAWHAVGVGPAYVSGVQSDFTTLDTIGCQIPHTVTFTNTSNNATAFIWDFGDGNTSTAVNPTHTYTGYGPYSVELYANGGACGDDTLMKIANISVDTNLPCPIILTRNVSLLTTQCTGTLFDDGGASGDYTPNQNSYMRISPTSAVNVTLNFAHFDVESGTSGTNCNYDYMEVYDGANTSATLLGRYCNNNPPPASISSSGGDIYIKFHTDGGLHLSGFKIDWSCLQHTSPYPLAIFSANDTNICTNESIIYTNNSYNGTTFSWSFPGGSPATSSAVSPTVSYPTAGSYITRLIATNASGNDTTYQTVIVNATCPLVLVANDSTGTTSCHGKLIDDGGLSGDYSANQTTYATIAPVGAGTVTFTFNTFDVEADNCIYDYMMIYDGPSTSSPILGKYCNSSLPPNPLTSSGGALTVKFYADAGLELSGFDIDWNCSSVGIDEINKISNINIYPNPSKDYVNVEVGFTNASQMDLKVIDLLGKVIYVNNSDTKAIQFTDRIDVSKLAVGTYIIYVNNEAHKFIKQ
ncbi:M4 family metallopeptidase [Flavobacteriales bacterium]|nr:M4 family metallopeptidase [Flavobacteriales bacterium]